MRFCSTAILVFALSKVAFCQDMDQPISKLEVQTVELNTDARSANQALRENRATNPYHKQASYASIIDEADLRLSRWSIWETSFNESQPNDEPEFRLLREICKEKLSAEQFSAMEKTFAERKDQHVENRALIQAYLRFESRLIMSTNGVSPKAVSILSGSSGEAKVDPSTFGAALAKYKSAEQKCEEELADKLDEILRTTERIWFAKFFHRNCLYLAHPFIATHLGLTKPQQGQIRAYIDEFRKYELEVREKRKLSREKNPTAPPEFLKSEEFWIKFYRPFTVLTPSQFTTIAGEMGIMKTGETLEDFENRLDQHKGPLRKALLDYVRRCVSKVQ